MSGLISMYVTGLELEDYFVSNQNGEPLAGGVVTFYEDQSRTTLKTVYQLSYNSMTNAYSYVALPNPMILSGVGTFQDSAGDNVAVYYYPYDTFGNQQLYYVTVYDAYGNLQFTREAWPYPLGITGGGGGGGGGGGSSAVGITNQLSNPTFAQTNINAGTTLTITIGSATTTTVPIAPDWSLVIVSTGAGSVMVTQTAKVGQLALPNNPPYTLDFVISSNIASCNLIQTLYQNPNWAAPQTTGVMGYLAGSILLGNNTSAALQYAVSNNLGSPQTIGSWTNTTGAYATFNATVQLAAANNTQAPPAAYDQIIVALLNLPGSSSISNVQVVPLTSNISGVAYDQTPVNRQFDHMFNYYNSLLQFKPIKSYLVGWDFPLNPAQFTAYAGGPFASGANTSNYILDQTILFQSANSGVTFSQASDGALITTAAANTQLALIQYLEAPLAQNLLASDWASMVTALTNQTNGIAATVSFWYTTASSLPAMGSNLSLVATLDSNGHPATLHGSWTEFLRSPNQNALLTIPNSAAFSSIGFSGWLTPNPTYVNSATFIAIVVGTAQLTSANNITWRSISCVPGRIPTIPAPQTMNEVRADCQRYYECSFLSGTVPVSGGSGANLGFYQFSQIVGASTGQIAATVTYQNRKRITTAGATVTIYNPFNSNAQIYDASPVNTDWSGTTVDNITEASFKIFGTTPAGSSAGNSSNFHWSADARLGVVT